MFAASRRYALLSALCGVACGFMYNIAISAQCMHFVVSSCPCDGVKIGVFASVSQVSKPMGKFTISKASGSKSEQEIMQEKESIEALITACREYYAKNGHYPKRTHGHDGYHLAIKRKNFLQRKILTPALRKALEEVCDSSDLLACEPHRPPATIAASSTAASSPLSLPGLTSQHRSILLLE